MESDTFVTGSDTATVEPSVKETPEVSHGTETDASEVSQDTAKRASDSRESTDGGRANENGYRPRRDTKLDTIRQLRAERREWQSEIGTLKQQIEEMKSLFRPGKQPQKQSKTFWEAPEEVMEERMQSQLAALKDELLNSIRQSNTESQQTSQWKQETSEATKFIQSQKGITEEDAEDIAEIVRSTPEMQNMSPMQRARYGLFLWREQRGITDKSGMKAKASTVIGAAPAIGGPKIWTDADIEAELGKYPKDPKRFTKEQSEQFAAFEREIRRAQKEGRVK